MDEGLYQKTVNGLATKQTFPRNQGLSAEMRRLKKCVSTFALGPDNQLIHWTKVSARGWVAVAKKSQV